MKLKIKRSSVLKNRAQEDEGAFSEYDLFSSENYFIKPHELRQIKTGVFLEIPKGVCVKLFFEHDPLTNKRKIFSLPKIIKSGPMREVEVSIFNFGDRGFSIMEGDKVSYFVVEKFLPIEWEEIE